MIMILITLVSLTLLSYDSASLPSNGYVCTCLVGDCRLRYGIAPAPALATYKMDQREHGVWAELKPFIAKLDHSRLPFLRAELNREVVAAGRGDHARDT